MRPRKRPPSSTSTTASAKGSTSDKATESPASAEAAAQCGGGADRPDDLLRAGLTALDNVRNDVVKHHTDMIERLLGIHRQPGGNRFMPTLGLHPLESFGLRKFEDVLDQRVATALQRLGYPGIEQMQSMRDEILRLRSLVDDLQARVQAQDDAFEARSRRVAAAKPRAKGKSSATEASGGRTARRKRPASSE